MMIEFIADNYVEIFAIVGGVLSVSTAIAKLTPTDKDDKFLEKCRKFFENVSNLFLPDVKK